MKRKFTASFYITGFLLLLVIFTSCGGKVWETVSPDGNLEITVFMEKYGKPYTDSERVYYRIELGKKVLVEDSPLGIETSSGSFFEEMKFISRKDSLIDETFPMVTGKKSLIRNNANVMKLRFGNKQSGEINIEFRAYNDGAAFRYIIDGEGSVELKNELSGFRIPDKSSGWLQPYTPNHELMYERIAGSDTTQKEIGFPALFNVPDAGWVLITEASVYGSYAGAHLKGSINSPSIFSIELPDSISWTLPWTTPWRVIIAGTPGKIFESTLAECLNPPSEAEDTSWIEPGLVTFPWWSDHFANGDYKKMKTFVDLAAEMGWKWIEFDVSLIGTNYMPGPQWKTTPWVKDLVDYSVSKGVNVYGWDHWKNLDTPEKQEEILGTYQKLGIKGIKVDYLESDSQQMMAFREEISRECLKRHLMLSFHGETVPRGQQRRFPNVMTLEGVKGAEWYTLAEYGNLKGAPVHNCTLPFTRNVTGSMDYTPVSFSAKDRETTDAHELALPVIFESGWMCIADKPDAILNSPGRDFLKNLPSSWDDTHFIDGIPGEFICIARRKASDWYIAGINASGKKSLKIDTGFLKKGIYETILYYDSENFPIIDKKIITLENGKPINIEIRENGGFCLKIEKSFDNPERNGQ